MKINALLSISLSALLLACQAGVSLPPAALPGPRTAVTARSVSSHSITGQVARHAQLRSQHLQHARDVLVWLPPGYDSSQQRYPVLYMHDGNNLFDRRTSFGGSEWEVDERAEQLIRQGSIQPVIIVGIYNSPARMDEYTWHPMALNGQMQGGQGAQYARFVVEELKPLIDQTYRTRPERAHTAMMGSSLGGLISFYTARAYPQVFGQVGLMSPSIWWKDRQILNDLDGLPPDLRIWLDMGTREGRQPEVMLQNAKDMARALEQRGFEHFRNLAFHVAPDADHSERAWAARIEHPLRFFYGASASTASAAASK
ncbi:MAG: alpha/beta hydrolase [Candidatus Sericytochromatia bacterium]|nr:alpha/beta hydrolase [Candidatus Sericytochromatia bacterium]